MINKDRAEHVIMIPVHVLGIMDGFGFVIKYYFMVESNCTCT